MRRAPGQQRPDADLRTEREMRNVPRRLRHPGRDHLAQAVQRFHAIAAARQPQLLASGGERLFLADCLGHADTRACARARRNLRKVIAGPIRAIGYSPANRE